MSVAIPLLTDFLAATALLAWYFHRHQRRDLLLAYAALNCGVVAVTLMLASGAVNAGLGLGLFGILSIIRLRSDAITQEEIGYYFVFLALGLVAGLRPGPLWVTPALTVLLVAVMVVIDHPRVCGQARRQVVTIDAAFTDERQLRRHLEDLYGASIRHVIVHEVDLVRDLTVVDVRFRLPAHRPIAPPESTIAAQRYPAAWPLLGPANVDSHR